MGPEAIRGAAPSPSDLEMKLDGCERPYLKARVQDILRRIHHNMAGRGFMDPRSSTDLLQSGSLRIGMAA